MQEGDGVIAPLGVEGVRMPARDSMDGPDLDEAGGESARELRRALISDALIDEGDGCRLT